MFLGVLTGLLAFPKNLLTLNLYEPQMTEIPVLDASYKAFRDDRIISRFSNHVPEFYVWNYHHKIPRG
jgi:hypothetical protein